MSYPVKGTVIVTDGSGRVIGIPPGNDDEVMIYDSTQTYGLKKTSSPGKKIFKLNQAVATSTKNTTYTTMYSFAYPGANISSINQVLIISSMDSGITSYDIRISDITNSTVIATQNYTNTTSGINTISSFSNLPTSNAIFEIQAKKNGGSANANIYVSDITFIYL